MANKKNSKKNNKKKNAPEAAEAIKNTVILDPAEVVEDAIDEAAEVNKDTIVLDPAEAVEDAVEKAQAEADAVPVEVVPVEEEDAAVPADEPESDVVPEPEAAEEKTAEIIEPVDPAEEAEEAPEEVIDISGPEESSTEVTDFTLVMDPVDFKNDAQAAATQDNGAPADASQGQVSPEEEKLAAEYAAARAEGPAASTAITPIIPVTGYGDSSNTVEFDAPKANKEPKESKLKGFFDKPVSRKFLAGSLGLALVLNGLIAAGIMALFANDIEDDISSVKKSVKELEENSGNMGGGPGMGMTPPDWNSGNDNGWDSGNGFYDRDDSDSGNYWDDDWDDDDRSGSAPDSQQNGQDNQYGQQSSSGPSIGIVISDNNGVYISQVTGGNAQKAGFKEGDKIVEFDGEDIDDSNELISELKEHKSGDKVTVVVERDGKEQKIRTTLE